MGNRLHVAKKYDVQYASYENFNWQCEEFHSLLDALGISYTGDAYDYEFEVNKDEWQTGTNTLRCLTTLHDQQEREEIQFALDRLSLTAHDAVQIFENYYEKSDSNNTMLHFLFF